MAKRWLELNIAIPANAVDLVTQVLMELGCTGVIAAEQTLDTFVVPDPDLLPNAPILRAFFPAPEKPEVFRQAILEQLEDLLPLLGLTQIPALEWHELADEDWASNWQQNFPPIRVGRHLVICPSWEEWHESPGDKVLTLDPGQAFGTGTHATTSLCLEVVAACYAEDAHPPQRVLDVGTGSGILAMAAALLGADDVLACDIDENACQVARANVAKNGLSNRVKVTNAPVEEISGRYDLVLANILAAENIRLSGQLVAHLAPGGTMVLSGILADQQGLVTEGFAGYPLTLVDCIRREEWICMVYRRHE